MKTLDEIIAVLERDNRALETIKCRLGRVYPLLIKLEAERIKMLPREVVNNVRTAHAIEEMGEIVGLLGEIISTQADMFFSSMKVIVDA